MIGKLRGTITALAEGIRRLFPEKTELPSAVAIPTDK